jgi:anaerobic selenocysteine-containing dehydrogenase
LPSNAVGKDFLPEGAPFADPRRVGLASKADLWLRARPGSDGALALGIANVMIEHGWYDRDFIREWSNSW